MFYNQSVSDRKGFESKPVAQSRTTVPDSVKKMWKEFIISPFSGQTLDQGSIQTGGGNMFDTKDLFVMNLTTRSTTLGPVRIATKKVPSEKTSIQLTSELWLKRTWCDAFRLLLANTGESGSGERLIMRGRSTSAIFTFGGPSNTIKFNNRFRTTPPAWHFSLPHAAWMMLHAKRKWAVLQC